MNKLFNWTFGSFFRTLGRFLFYLLIGFLITQLINISDIKLPSIFDVLQVDALQIGGVEYYTPSEIALYNNTSSSSSSLVSTNWVSVTGTGMLYKEGQVSTTTSGYGASWCFNTGITFMNGYIYSVQVVVMNVEGHSFNIVTNDNYDMLRLGYSLSDASTHSGSTTINYFGTIYDTHGVYMDNFNVQTKAYILTYLFTSKLNSQYICVPFRHYVNTSNETEQMFGIKVDVIGQSNLVTNASLNSAISSAGLASASSVSQVQSSINQVQQEIQGTQSAIEDQTEQQQQQHEEIMNDDIDNDEIEDFVDDMGQEPSSLTPFSDFINLPLTWVQSLLASNQNCQMIRLPLPFLNNKTLDLPCMTEFWDRLGTLKTLIELVWVAIVGVRIFNGLFLLTCDVIDPNPDRDMTKLRTWEL